MDAVGIAAIVVSSLALAVVAIGLLRTRRQRRTVVVHTRDNRSLRGVLVGSYLRTLVLRHSVFLQDETETELSGDVVIDRSNVSFIQRTD